MPLVYISLDIPKRIINQAIDGKDLPETLLGFEITQISFLMLLSVVFLVVVVATGGLKYYLNVYKGVLGERIGIDGMRVLARYLRQQVVPSLVAASRPHRAAS